MAIFATIVRPDWFREALQHAKTVVALRADTDRRRAAVQSARETVCGCHVIPQRARRIQFVRVAKDFVLRISQSFTCKFVVQIRRSSTDDTGRAASDSGRDR
jgi:hypothetical protein